MKEEEVYKIINKAFIDEDNPFKKIELHRKFNTQWGTVYSRDVRLDERRNNGNVP